MYDWLHAAEVEFLIWLQSLALFRSENCQTFWLFITKLGDPASVFWIYLPLLHAFLPQLSSWFLLTGILAEVTNAILKWFLQGERPYWWIRETDYYESTSPPVLTQFHLTCETGPGSPSGHVMVSAAVWYVVLNWYLKQSDNKKNDKGNKPPHPSKVYRYTAVALYTLLLLLVGKSRLYIGAHFPHQVVAGAVLGIILGRLVVGYTVHVILDLRKCLLISFFCAVASAVSLFILYHAGIDSEKSVALALKWCANSEWIHLSTTPLASLFRDFGALIGLGFRCECGCDQNTVKLFQNHGRKKKHRHSDNCTTTCTIDSSSRTKSTCFCRMLVTALTSLVLVQLLGLLPMPHSPLWALYTATFFQCGLVSYISVVVGPFIANKLLSLFANL